MARRTIGKLALAAIGLLCMGTTATATGAPAKKDLPALTAPSRVDGLARAVAGGRISEAQAALYRAEALFRPAAVERRFGAVARPGPRDATMILRDLVLRLGELSGAEQRTAAAILARPDGDPVGYPGRWSTAPAPGSPECGPHVCVHWTTGGGDQPNLSADDDGDNVPNWVETTLAEMENTVWATEVTTMGYKAPKSDLASADNGGDAKLDIYISNLGPDGFYGYCTSDDPKAAPTSSYKFFDFSAYCVVDNNYSEAIFNAHTPLENLQVTLAHEFFHAVQFAYDAAEDLWLMEGTATWMEEQIYDGIDDNRQYLADSQLVEPHMPLDRSAGCCSQYGAWIWWEYLTQRLGDNSFIRDVWERADGSPTGPDKYSLQAARGALSARSLKIRPVYGDFAVWNRIPAAMYDEGTAYPHPPTKAIHKLGPSNRSTGWVATKLNHLTSVYYTVSPGTRASTTGHVTVRIDGPRLGWGPEARAMVFTTAGDVRTRAFPLNASGDGQLKLGFARGEIQRVVVIMSNASQRFRCWRGTTVSCQGQPLDNNRTYQFRASLS